MPKKKEKKYKTKTISFFVKKTYHNRIFSIMAHYSKNVYNSSLFCYNAYITFKNNIYKELYDLQEKEKLSENNINDKLYEIYEKYYKLYSDNFRTLIINNKLIYKYIITNYDSKKVSHSNLESDKKKIKKELTELKSDIKYNDTNKDLVFNDIIDNILNSFYRRNYLMTKNELLNKKPLTTDNKEFIKHVKNDEYLLSNEDIKWKQKIKKEYKLNAEQTIFMTLAYHHLGDNKDKLPSSVIQPIINKAFANISGYYGARNKNLHARMPKYLKKNEIYNIIFNERVFRKYNNEIRLTIGKHIGENYRSLISRDHIRIPNTTKYIKRAYLTRFKEDEKIPKTYKPLEISNGIVRYYRKNNPNIIDVNFLYIRIPYNLDKLMKYNQEKAKIKKINTIEIVPVHHKFKINITYTSDVRINNNVLVDSKSKDKVNIKNDLKIKDTVSIDLGLVNLMTIYNPFNERKQDSKNNEHKIIKGGPIKSINEYFNKRISKYKSINKKVNKSDKTTKRIENLWIKRNNKINDYFNKLVKKFCKLYEDKKVVIVGYNELWKQNINIGTNNNRNFCSIPYKKLLEKLRDQLGDYHIILTEVNESYTSKCDALSLETIEKHEEYKGKRIKRGLFKSGTGKIINADLNGAINICRKFFKDKYDKIIGYINHPRKLVV